MRKRERDEKEMRKRERDEKESKKDIETGR